MNYRTMAAAVVLLAGTALTASAQTRGFVGVGVGVGGYPGGGYYGYPGWNYYGLPYGPYAYGYPSALGTQWSNGHSLYGPPIPTFGPTPGAFGGGDAHRGHYTYGFLGNYSPSPRLGYSTVNVYPSDRQELTGPSVDAIAPNEVPRSQTSSTSPWVKGGLLGFGVIRRR
ncbi:TIGR03000 domain-containing protein [Limnoglobus roseus]|uniref:TIGR03000 domain-containing protein n=2 Tax=Limnoglobus roseus TaxID=2598579 RepID=A0A5C1AS87_9BACT|nr:TIGR03000 domain-containing protein [Limnoglobus roseus]